MVSRMDSPADLRIPICVSSLIKTRKTTKATKVHEGTPGLAISDQLRGF
jgi:hypothetical protein